MKFNLVSAADRYAYLEALSINFVHAFKDRLGDETPGAQVAGELALHAVMAALQDQFGWDGEEVAKSACQTIGQSLAQAERAEDLPLEDIADWVRQGWMEGREMLAAKRGTN